MLPDILRLIFLTFRDLPPFAVAALRQRLAALYHHHTYTPLPPDQTKNVIIIGGSFTGYQAAKRLTETLPNGYRVVLVEKNSHLNYVFAFPRFSVVKGHEHYAFIPYTGLAARAPPGIFERVQGRVVGVDERVVRLESGEVLPYEYLVIATGTDSGPPSKAAAVESADAQAELRGLQGKVEEAGRIAVVGGGAVGVELATDIKDVYPGKSVVLVHSRARVLHGFGEKLSEYVEKRLGELGVEVWLGERATLVGSRSIRLAGGKQEEFDLVIPCTGQRPNSSILASLSPASISKATSEILVRPTLQIADENFPHVFAVGDVAATGGPKMGRAALTQSEALVHNMLTLITKCGSMKPYKPLTWLEGSIKLTLGIRHLVMYAREEGGKEILIPLNMGKEDMDVKRQWRFFGADLSSSKEVPAAGNGV